MGPETVRVVWISYPLMKQGLLFLQSGQAILRHRSIAVETHCVPNQSDPPPTTGRLRLRNAPFLGVVGGIGKRLLPE